MEREETSIEAAEVLVQEPNNKKTKLVFTKVKLANGFIASDKTGAYPRTFNKSTTYNSVFYMYDTYHIKGIALK